jgi:hypothetical protein
MPAGGPAQTALMPLDPTVSPIQSLRVLPIRADLLPEEITASRSARRARTLLAGALVLTVAALAGWYVYAVKDREAARQDLAAVTKQVDDTRDSTKDDRYVRVTKAIDEAKTIKSQLTTAMADDLPWYTLVSELRGTGVSTVRITNVSAQLDTKAAGTTTGPAPATKTVGTVTVTGTARDKKTIATYLEALSDAHLVTNVYLTSGSGTGEGDGDKAWTFSLTAEIPQSAPCGRFTTACKTGGK